MVKRLKLNEKMLRDAEPIAGKSYQIFDTEILGLAARINSSGMRGFTLDYRFAGRQRRMTIGRWPEWSVTAARERAKELRRMIDEGFDPLSQREDLREAPRITDMIDRYIREHLPRLAPANASDQISMLRKMLEPAWGNRLVTDITKSDVARFLDFVAEGRPRPCKQKPNNRAVGGAQRSKHMDGTAFDIAMSNHDPATFEAAAREVGFLGFGFYPRSGFIHIDLGPARVWGERFPVRATAFAPEARPAREVLAESRTLKGTGAAGVATVGAAGVEGVREVLSEAQSAILPLVPYLDTLRWLFIALALAGIAVAIWARIDDWKKGLR